MSARWVTWIEDEAATVELVSKTDDAIVARIETASGVREVRFAIASRYTNGERLVRQEGRSTAAWIGPELRDERTISVARKDIVVRAKRELDAVLGAGDDGAGSGAVSVAMPGRVVKVLAQVGDKVDKGQPVLIVEAMKMENEVKAKRAGTVLTVLVAEGSSVEGGKVLMEIGD